MPEARLTPTVFRRPCPRMRRSPAVPKARRSSSRSSSPSVAEVRQPLSSPACRDWTVSPFRLRVRPASLQLSPAAWRSRSREGLRDLRCSLNPDQSLPSSPLFSEVRPTRRHPLHELRKSKELAACGEGTSNRRLEPSPFSFRYREAVRATSRCPP